MRRLFFITFSSLFLLFLTANKVLAQAGDALGIDDLAEGGVALGTRSIQETIALVINIFLGFLGTLAVILLLYGGFLWMTSKGSAEKIQKAKLVISSAIIGLLIILSSYFIARFILNTLYEATVSGPAETTDDDDDDISLPDCPEPDDPTQPIICSINRLEGPAGTVIRIRGYNFDTDGDQDPGANGRVIIGGETAEIVACGGSPYWRQKEVRVKVPDLSLNLHEVILYNDLDISSIENPRFQFNVTDSGLGPNIYCLDPDREDAGDLPVEVNIEGIGFGNDIESLSMQGWDSVNGEIVNLENADLNITEWQDNLITFTVPANALTSRVTVEVDGQSDDDLFRVRCSSHNDCSSVCCHSNFCRAAAICAGSGTPGGPVIYSISPDNSGENNLITIHGSGFGNMAGVVTFDAAGETTVLGNPPSSLNPACPNFWSDSHIIIAVPPTADSGLVTVTNDDGDTSNGLPFVRNEINRPGICYLDPNQGSFETNVNISGILFSATDRVFFGSSLSSYNYIDINNYQAQVPNIVGNVGVTLVTDAGEESNPYPFTALASVSGLPIINSVSPEEGPRGQYVIVMGANFGNNPGQLLFGSTPGDFDFPPACGGNYWRNNRIIVKVPDMATGNQPIQIIRSSDNAESNEYGFTVTADLPGPQICNVSPDNGPVGTSVNFVGENFGTVEGSVIFHNSILAIPTSWTNNSITAPVPTDAQTGLVMVRDATATESNPWPFNVGNCPDDAYCTTNILGDYCCPTHLGSVCQFGPCGSTNFCEYSWTITTTSGELMVEQYSPNCDGACTTAEIFVRFNNPIATTTFDINVDVIILNDGNLVPILDHTFGGGDRNLHIELPVPLSVNATYQVTLSTGFRDILGNALSNPFPWTFTTGNDICYISDAVVSPSTYTSNIFEQVINYRINGINNSAECGEVFVNCNSCTYDWALTGMLPEPPPDPASIYPDDDHNDEKIVRVQNNVAVGETGSATVLGTIFDNTVTPARNFPASGDLIMESTGSMITPLAIIGHWPDCNGVCTSPIVRVRFNRAVDPSSVATDLISFIRSDGNVTFNSEVNFTGSNEYMEIGYNPPLVEYTEYQVILLAGFISDNNGVAIASDYTWTFETGGDACVVNAVQVLPEEHTSNTPTELSRFDATPMRDDQTCGYIPVYCSECEYRWYLSDINVASISGAEDDRRVRVRNDLGNLENGQTFVNVELEPDPATSLLEDFGILNIDNSGSVVSYATPQIIDYQPTGPNICTNASIYIDFSELMDRNSISDNIGLYTGVGNEVPGSFRFVSMNLDDDPQKETRAIFEPAELLDINSNYYVIIENYNLVLSQNGMPLDPSALSSILTPFGMLYGWGFNTGGEVCDIYHASINPNPDWFTCTGNNCVDNEGPMLGNQHQFSALVYSIAGQLLNNSLLNFTWSLTDTSLATLVDTLAYPSAGTGVGNVYVTAGEFNGQVTLGMSVDNDIPDDDSSANASSLINLWFCENPWPNNPVNFPWRDFAPPPLPIFNFSSFYCQYSGLPGSTALPNLQYPPNMTTPPPTGVLREYIMFVTGNLASLENNNHLASQLGSLQYQTAVAETKKVSKNNWLTTIALFLGIERAKGQPEEVPMGCLLILNTEPSAYNFTATESGSNVILNWKHPTSLPPDRYRISRRISSAGSWTNVAYINTPELGQNTHTDTITEFNRTYEYRLEYTKNDLACQDVMGNLYWFAVNASVYIPIPELDTGGTDIIGVRVMANPDHLSVRDWFSRNAPNPNLPGNLIEVDGYEALQVGSTIYIAGTNITTSPNRLWTNIYIIAHNVGARPATLDIYNQLVENFKLNINVGQGTNVCANDSTLSCSSDFDCEDGICLSQGLKLRRDTKRLGDLVNSAYTLAEYGNNHKACSGNSLISCSQDSDCPISQNCVPYYPILSAGTYLPGLSTSKWPSWQDTFSPALGSTVPQDPINLFNGCPAEYDSETCWNNLVDPNRFFCPLNSLVYMYSIEEEGRSYGLRANFEYNIHPHGSGAVTFNNLFPSLSANPDYFFGLSIGLNNCSGNVVNAPGGPGSAYCGDGIKQDEEECDGGFIDACPDGYNWWTPRMVGCNPPGTMDSDGNLIECTWYQPDPPFSPAQCGGFCGDSIIQSYYEQCEETNFGGKNFICRAVDSLYCHDTGCQAMCNDSAGPDYPAALCGDGVWSAGIEDCDLSASPNGLENWGCTEGGIVSCNSLCQVTCNPGTPYQGYCGDGELQIPQEECDFANYDVPTPHQSGLTNAYGCNTLCQFTSQYCGDGFLQTQFGEICDYDADYSSPPPEYSSPFNQYQCRHHITNPALAFFQYNGQNYGACTATLGGYCRDGIIQDGTGGTEDFGEICDPGDPWRGISQSPLPPQPHESDADNQYSCRADCQGRTGGYCGDGIIQNEYEEICDGLNYPDRPLPSQSSAVNTYNCDLMTANKCKGSLPASLGGRYCGDGEVQAYFGEQCDIGTSGWPWPRTRTEDAYFNNFSDLFNQYECTDCTTAGGYCGDGIIQAPYEDCDPGYLPAEPMEKKVDVVYVFDTSGSMTGPANQLCSSLQSVITKLEDDDLIEYRITIYPMGDINTLTPGYDYDDISTVNNTVFSNLVTNCSLWTASSTYPHVRYLSPYDIRTLSEGNASDIYGGARREGEGAPYPECTDSWTSERLENWGYVSKRIIQDYNWLDGYQRVIIPVSDEGAHCGNPIEEWDDYQPSIGYPDVLLDVVSLANTGRLPDHYWGGSDIYPNWHADYPIKISPVLISNIDEDLWDIGEAIATDTGGYFTWNTNNWEVRVMETINSVFCDGTGDGFVDCTFTGY